MTSSNRRGVSRLGRSPIELLSVIAVLAVLLSLLIPRIQRSRERARQTRCQSNLINIALAIKAYHTTHNHYPAGTVLSTPPACNRAEGFHHNWLSELAEPLGMSDAASMIDRSVSVYAKDNDEVRLMAVPRLRCPTFDDTRLNATHYAGNTGPKEAKIDAKMDGVFFANRWLNQAAIVDGLEHTVFVGEKFPLANDLGWLSGTRSSLRNGGHPINASGPNEAPGICQVGGFGSPHLGGAHLLRGSGAWSMITPKADPTMLEQLTNRHDTSQ